MYLAIQYMYVLWGLSNVFILQGKLLFYFLAVVYVLVLCLLRKCADIRSLKLQGRDSLCICISLNLFRGLKKAKQTFYLKAWMFFSQAVKVI